MFNKSEIITKLSNSKTLHERWMSYAEAIYNGIPIGEEHTPLLHTECEFGKWLQANGQLLYHVEAPKSLHEDHKVLHSVYMELYKLMNDDPSTNVFNKSRIERKKQADLDKNFKVLNSISKNLINSLNNIIERINSMTSEEINSLG